jgi:hypothetical protein
MVPEMLLLLMQLPHKFPNSLMEDSKKLLHMDLSRMTTPNWRELPAVINSYENLLTEIVDFEASEEQLFNQLRWVCKQRKFVESGCYQGFGSLLFSAALSSSKDPDDCAGKLINLL